jgi:hypothetical protein
MPADRDAQEKRAERLREEIERLRKGGEDENEDAAEPPRSPREFIEKRMRELDEVPADTER